MTVDGPPSKVESVEAGRLSVAAITRLLLTQPNKPTRRFYQIAGSMLGLSLLISGFVGSADVRNNPGISASHIWAAEATSHIAIFILLPLFPFVFGRFSKIPSKWTPVLGWLIASLTAFWLAHVLMMWIFRMGVYPLAVGSPYNVNLFAPHHLFYEFSKDIFTYALLAFGFVTIRGVLNKQKKAEALSGQRITVRTGATIHHLRLDDIISASAAANYVDIRLSDRTVLARLSLANFARLLRSESQDFVRVHRSHLVNKTKIKTIVPRGDGGARIEMTDGSSVPVSRRYRGVLTEETETKSGL